MMSQITVGLDFGTHNTKLCVEDIDGNEKMYKFFPFKNNGKDEFLLPSEMFIANNGKITYGFVGNEGNGRFIQNFKQRVFTDLKGSDEDKLYCIWFIANIIFDLEKEYSDQFTIQMGVPADNTNLTEKKKLAKSIVASAYYLVEDVFKNDKNLFLKTTEQELISKTVFIVDEEKIKSYGTLIFPEAYAYLLMFTKRDAIPSGMSLIVDLGGSTTDISFFNISTTGMAGQNPVIYSFHSLNIGTNQLYLPQEISDKSKEDEIKRSWLANKLSSLGSVKWLSKSKAMNYKVLLSDKVNEEKLEVYKEQFDKTCEKIVMALLKRYRQQRQGSVAQLLDALSNRPIIFAGGGSMNSRFRLKYEFKGNKQQCFSDPKLITSKDWEAKDFDKEHLKDLEERDLIALLSTAYGLAHASDDMNDDIEVHKIEDIFGNYKAHTQTEYDVGFNYGLDYDAVK
ncbi:MAG: hypothetical protein IK114_11615 [Fibrobacter sp.]|nr:hypothetical protein [Fibrobacter sp.]